MKDEKILKIITAGSVLMLCFVLMFSSLIRKTGTALADTPAEPTPTQIPDPTPAPTPTPVLLPTPYATAAPTPVPSLQPVLSEAWSKVTGAGKSDFFDDLTSRTIVIEKTEGYRNAVLSWEEDAVHRQLSLVFTGVKGECISDEQIVRISEETYFRGTPPSPTPTMTPTPTPKVAVIPSHLPQLSPTPTLSPDDPFYPWRNDVVRAIRCSDKEEKDGSHTQRIVFTLDKTYVYHIYEDEWNYYISLIRPKDVYPRIVVIDAGHGGNDPGACSEGNLYTEEQLNLDMLLYLKQLLDCDENIKAYYTRTTDTRPSQMERVTLANDLEADFMLSIHCNANNSRKLNGTEVLYNMMQNKWTGMNSRRFSQICLEELDEHLGLKNNGIVARDHDVTVVKEARMPVALIETGYMSNQGDVSILAQEETKQAVAEGIYHAILRAYEEMEAAEK